MCAQVCVEAGVYAHVRMSWFLWFVYFTLAHLVGGRACRCIQVHKYKYLYIYTYIHIHIYMYTYMYIHIYYIFINVYVCMDTFVKTSFAWSKPTSAFSRDQRGEGRGGGGRGRGGKGTVDDRADRESQETWMRLSRSFVAKCRAPHLLLLPSTQRLLSPNIRLSSFFLFVLSPCFFFHHFNFSSQCVFSSAQLARLPFASINASLAFTNSVFTFVKSCLPGVSQILLFLAIVYCLQLFIVIFTNFFLYSVFLCLDQALCRSAKSFTILKNVSVQIILKEFFGLDQVGAMLCQVFLGLGQVHVRRFARSSTFLENLLDKSFKSPLTFPGFSNPLSMRHAKIDVASCNVLPFQPQRFPPWCLVSPLIANLLPFSDTTSPLLQLRNRA